MMTFGGHLEVLRQMLFRIIAVATILTIIIFCFKDITWGFLLAPSEWDFITYRMIESFMHWMGFESFAFERFHVDLIATGLSSQFMNHVTTSVTLGLLGASPYILYELFRYISPALLKALLLGRISFTLTSNLSKRSFINNVSAAIPLKSNIPEGLIKILSATEAR